VSGAVPVCPFWSAAISAEDLEKSITAIKGEMIGDIEVESTTVSVWVEGLDSPIRFEGESNWYRSGYETRDHLRAIEVDGWIKSQQQEDILKLRNTIREAVGFIERTIERIEKKQELIRGGDHEYRSQLELLRRVRRKLDNEAVQHVRC